MPEWLKGADCKSADYVYVGSNPTRPTKSTRATWYFFCPDGSGVERVLGKDEVPGSIPGLGSDLFT